MENKELNEQELETVIGGIENDNTIHPVFMWKCSNCGKYFAQDYSGWPLCDVCDTKTLVWTRIM